MKGKHIVIMVLAIVGQLSVFAFGSVLLAVGAYYIATQSAARQYKDVASIVVMKPPPPREAFNFRRDFRVNTADRGETNWIKLKLSLGYAKGNAALSAELASRAPQLRNIINLILAGKTKAQLDSVSEQLELREEIKASINHVLKEGKVEEVYFNEFIVN